MDGVALLLAFALVLLHGFFVAAELALAKVAPTRMEELARQGKAGAAMVQRALKNAEHYGDALRLGIATASLALAWVGLPALALVVEGALAGVGIIEATEEHRAAALVAFCLLALAHTTLGVLVPRALALMRTEPMALSSGWLARTLYMVTFPAVVAVSGAARGILYILGIRETHSPIEKESLSEEEIDSVLSQASDAGLLSPERADLLRKALTLTTKSAGHLMVPRNEVVFLDINLPLQENLARGTESKRTRFPLCDRELDEVIGIVDIRDILYELSRGEGPTTSRELERYARPPAYLPEIMTGERLLAEFRGRHITMAVIVDEYGGAAGIVTPADVVTAVMGELEEEDDDVVKLPGGAYDVEGTAEVEEVEDALQVNLGSHDTRTVAGFLMERLGRMPRVGDRVSEAGFAFHVVEVEGPRVRKVRIVRDSGMSRGRANTQEV